MRALRSLAFLVVMALASAGSAEAASRIFIIHGIPGVTVDVYANLAGAPISSTPTIPGFEPKQIVDVQAGPGSFDIRIYVQGANPQTDTPVIEVLGAAIPDNLELSILAHLDASAAPTATVYQNDNSAVQAGWARVSVRHAADAPAVQLTAGGVPKLALTNPYFGDLEVPATTIPLQLQVPFAGTPITPETSLTFASGTRYFVYAIGSVAGGTFDFILQAVR
ncbi:MAG: DUF4397 domain-containing protein [Acidobacteria bacterium]|nr:DUF4397 domain-containing protein [Acidobacteriota bacterium]